MIAMWIELSHENKGFIQPTALYWQAAARACSRFSVEAKVGCLYKSNGFSYLVQKDDFKKTGTIVLEKLKKDDALLKEIIKNNKEKIPLMLKEAENCAKKKTYEAYKRWLDSFLDMMELSVIGTILEMEEPLLSNEVERILKQRFSDKAAEYFQILAQSDETTSSQKEENDLIDVKNLEDARRHAEKYGFIAYGYAGPAWNAEDILERAKNAKRKMHEGFGKEKAELMMLLSDEERRLIEALNVLGFWKFERKLMNQKAHFIMDDFFLHISRKNDIIIEEAKMLLPEEIDKALEGRVDKDSIRSRLEECAIIVQDKNLILANKSELDNIKKDLLVVPEFENIKGSLAYPGNVRGKVVIINSKEDIGKFREGCILVSASTSPDMLPVMKLASAIITDTGGITCHAAIVAREIKVPTIIGTRIASKVLKDGMEVEVSEGKITIIGEKMKNILWFKEIRKNDVGLVGGKGASLGEMANNNFPVPEGFCVTAQAFGKFLDESGLRKQIYGLLEKTNVDDTDALQKTSDKIREMVIKAKMPQDIKEDIIKNYQKLAGFVAVRSSATAEDLPTASFAGQQDTYLNINGDQDVVSHVQRCWASLFTARAIFYREKNNFKHSDVLISVVVQKMVNSDSAGVMFSINPVTNDDEEIIIEGAFGLGEAVVAGMVNPDNYVVDKKNFRIKSSTVNEKKFGIFRDSKGKNYEKKFSAADANKRVLTDAQIKQLARIGVDLEKHYGWPQDMEWAVEGNKIYMTQSRPITTYKKQEKKTAAKQRFSLDMDFF